MALAEPTLVANSQEDVSTAKPFSVILWNDPINLIEYVVATLCKAPISLTRAQASTVTLTVHHEGKAQVACVDSLDEANTIVSALQAATLTATVERP